MLAVYFESVYLILSPLKSNGNESKKSISSTSFALLCVSILTSDHRDVYYCRIKKENLKPTSAIITTICAEIAYGMNPSMNVFELLQAIANDFEIYSYNQTLQEEEFSRQYIDKNIIRKRKGIWYIINPVNPKDNLADSWNDNPEKAQIFFKWVKAMKKDCLDSMNLEDNDFVALLENNFGRDYVKKNVKLEDYDSVVPNVIINTPKPWGK